MGDYQASTTVDVGAAALFDYVSQVRNLPDYVARMTSAEPGDGEAVHTVARMPDGQQVEGTAWFGSTIGPGASSGDPKARTTTAVHWR